MKDRKSKKISRELMATPQTPWLLLVPLVVAILYGGSIASPFVFDDSIHILRNPAVTSFQSLLDFNSLNRIFRSSFGLSARPLLMLSYALNYAASGANPSAFRWINLIVHTVNSIFVFLIVFELANIDEFGRRRRFWLSLLASLIFAAHPLATESVTYIAGRSASLVATFYFAALYVVLRAGRATQAAHYVSLVSALGLAGVGSLVKQDALTLPVACIASIWLAWPADVSSRRRWIATGILALAVMLVLATQLPAFGKNAIALTQGNSALVAAGYETTLPFINYAPTSIKAYSGYYLWRLWLPVSLSVDPEVATVESVASIGFLVSLGFLSLIAASILWLRPRRPLIAVGFALILTSPLSAYCLYPLADVVAEHRAYIAILGSAIVLADVVLRSRYALWISMATIVVYASLTIDRNKVWADEVQLWQDASRKAPEKVRPHLNLGASYHLRGETDHAIQEYEFVLRSNPRQTTALANLAALYTDRSDLQKAEALLAPAIDRKDSFAPIYVGMAVVRLRQGRSDDARKLLEYAYMLNPMEAMIHHNLGDVMFQENQPSSAVNEYLSELQINPDSKITHLHLANAYEVLGIRDKSIEQYEIVAKMDPANPQIQSALQRLK